ncbi:hypothetical protein [Rhodohalobacter sp. SW132]|uniref:hypothetical protein n=1 Tax=Rhodohalobacter sp. SW132 TaxID=2293433 RepID=UPI0011C03455|nr:hypothetical protein [Rhodohalobacter sp. SW132]
MMEKIQNNRENGTAGEFEIDGRSLQDRSRQELITLAKDLSQGCFKKESKQRRQILQMIVDRLAEKPGSPP